MSFTASHFHTCNWNSLRHNYWSVKKKIIQCAQQILIKLYDSMQAGSMKEHNQTKWKMFYSFNTFIIPTCLAINF